MTRWALLASGPSARRAQAEAAAARGLQVGVVGNAFELYPEAAFLAASDRRWWCKYDQARQFEGAKYSCQGSRGVQRLRVPSVPGTCNSGVLALEAAVQNGATHIELYGFDMHGSHFFGPYHNGLVNTSAQRRAVHLQEYEAWAAVHLDVRVVNCTPGSALACFEVMG